MEGRWVSVDFKYETLKDDRSPGLSYEKSCNDWQMILNDCSPEFEQGRPKLNKLCLILKSPAKFEQKDKAKMFGTQFSLIFIFSSKIFINMNKIIIS